MDNLLCRNCVRVALTACVMLAVAGSTSAFDGKRKGFILGGGLGPGLTSYTQSVGSSTLDRENTFAVMSDFKIGGAPSDQLQIYWMSKVSWFSKENVLGDNVTIANVTEGVGVTHYFQPTAPSPYVLGGVGYSTWILLFECGAKRRRGFGFATGAGYEFSPHWSIEGNLVYGKPTTEERGINVSTNALSVRFTLNYLAY